jgi:predicted HTH transcriptional regulator
MKMFSLINLSERAGSGIPNMIASWEKSGFQTPILEEQFDPEISRIILPLKAITGLQNKKVAKVSLAKEDGNAANVTHETNAEVALRIAHENGQVSTQLLASELGVSSATARKTLKSLQAQGKLKWVGKSKTDPTQHFTL